MLKAVKFQLKPNQEKITLFLKHVGCCRKVYNHFLNENIEYYRQTQSFIPIYELIKELPDLKAQYTCMSLNDNRKYGWNNRNLRLWRFLVKESLKQEARSL